MTRLFMTILATATVGVAAQAEDQFCNAYDATVYGKPITLLMSTTTYDQRSSEVVNKFYQHAVYELGHISFRGDENGKNKGWDNPKPKETVNYKLWWGPVWDKTVHRGSDHRPVTVTQSFGDMRRSNWVGIDAMNELNLREAKLDFTKLPDSLKIDRYQKQSSRPIKNNESGVSCRLVKTDERKLDYASPEASVPIIISGESHIGSTARWDNEKPYSDKHYAAEYEFFQTLRFSHKDDSNFGFALDCIKEHKDIDRLSDSNSYDRAELSFQNFTMDDLPDEILQAMSFKALDGDQCIDLRERADNLPSGENESILNGSTVSDY